MLRMEAGWMQNCNRKTQHKYDWLRKYSIYLRISRMLKALISKNKQTNKKTKNKTQKTKQNKKKQNKKKQNKKTHRPILEK